MALNLTANLVDLLIGISAFSVTIAGFSSIVIVLKSCDDAQWAKLQSSSIKAMLETSLTAALFALFPLFLSAFTQNLDAGLVVLLAVFGVWHGWILWLAVRREQRAAVWQTLGNPLVVVAVLVVLAQLIVGIGMFTEYVLAAYLSALAWLMLMAVLNFSFLLYSTMD